MLAAPVQKPAAPAKAAPPTFLVHGDDHSFVVSAPEGWVMDDSSGLGSKIRVVFYPRGRSWATSGVVMYANPLHQNAKLRAPLSVMIQRDVDSFRKQAPQGKVTAAPTIETLGHRKAEVRWFAPDGRDPVEACAYVAEDDMVMLLVLSAHTAREFHDALPAFDWLVKSYNFVGSDAELGQGR